MSESIFTQPRFQDADEARKYLESQVWPDGPVCPHCASVAKPYELKGKSNRPGLYKCADCREPFTVTVGTVFEKSKIPLHKWLMAVHLMCASKKGISAHQLHRMLGISYKSTWFMGHRIREAMRGKNDGKLGGDGTPVEVDETYWGTRKHAKKHKGGGAHKMKIFSLVERDGEKRSFRVRNVTGDTLRPIMRKQIERDSHIMTDDATVYKRIGKKFFDAHSSVNHSAGEYVRGIATTNTVESSFALLKRGLIGTFHQVGEQHLQRYADEFDFRWNHRKTTDSERACAALRGAPGRRLMYLPPTPVEGPNAAH